MRIAVALAAGLVACGGGEPASQYGDQVLEKGKVEVEEMSGVRKDLVGDLAITGSGSNWEITVNTTGASERIDLFSPGQSDLSVLDGEIDATVTLIEEPLSGEIGISITDSVGDLLYLFEPVGEGQLTGNTLGTGFANLGADLGVETVDLVTLHLSSVEFDDDAGTVEGLPGEPTELTLGGSSYRAVLIAAYDLELDPEAAVPNCQSLASLMSYEVVKAGEGADLTALVRPPNGAIAVGGCETL